MRFGYDCTRDGITCKFFELVVRCDIARAKSMIYVAKQIANIFDVSFYVRTCKSTTLRDENLTLFVRNARVDIVWLCETVRFCKT